MSSLILPSRRIAQPQGPVSLDWSNPLVRAINPVTVHCPSMGLLYNAAQRRMQGSPLNSPATIVVPEGKGLYSPASGVDDGKLIKTGIYPDSSYTFFATFCLFPSGLGGIPGYTNGLHDGTRRFYVSSSNDTNNDSAYAGWGSNILAAPIGVIPAGGSNMVAMSRGVDGVLSMYVDGVFRTSGASAWTGGTSPRQIFLGKRTLNDANDNDRCQGGPETVVTLAIIGKGSLDAGAVKALYKNPWQIFKPASNRIYFDMGAAGGGASSSISTATASATFSGSAKVSPLAALSVISANAVFSGSAQSTTAAAINATTADATVSSSAQVSPVAAISAAAGASSFAGSANVSPLASIGITTEPSVFTGSATVSTGSSILAIAADSIFVGSAYVSPLAAFNAVTSASSFGGSASASTAPVFLPDPTRTRRIEFDNRTRRIEFDNRIRRI